MIGAMRAVHFRRRIESGDQRFQHSNARLGMFRRCGEQDSPCLQSVFNIQAAGDNRSQSVAAQANRGCGRIAATAMYKMSRRKLERPSTTTDSRDFKNAKWGRLPACPG